MAREQAIADKLLARESARHVETAFAQLQFAIKLMHATECGAVTLDNIDVPLTIADGESVIVLPDQMFATTDDLINACQNAVSMAFGAAAIALNRYREEFGILLPDLICSESDHWVALVYQIRNAFAHDVARPKWCIRGRFARQYRIGRVCVDLRGVHGAPFDYAQIGGPDKLFALKEYGFKRVRGELANIQMEPTRAGSRPRAAHLARLARHLSPKSMSEAPVHIVP